MIVGRLHFFYGIVGSSKTAQALITRYNYMEKGLGVLFMKPATDTRDGVDIIRSRIGLQAKVEVLGSNDSLYDRFKSEKDKINVIIIDEAQFMTPSQVEEARQIVDEFDVPILLYGLKTDFQSHLFEGSKRIIELADELVELKNICKCGRHAIINARLVNGKPTIVGETVDLGGDEKYAAMCHACWKKALNS